PVAIIGPTVRTLRRRPPEPPRPEARPAPRPTAAHDHDTGPVPVVREPEAWPDLDWSPGTGRPGAKQGPLPAPGPLPVPDDVRRKVSAPLGQVEDDDEADDGESLTAERWFPPARPTFKGAQSA